jgi:heat shock protein HslJ
MADDPDSPGPDTSNDPGSGGPRGFMVYIAIALIAILVFLVFFGNIMGPGAIPATTITENSWSLRSFSSPDGTVNPVLNGTTINATFSPDGKLTGYGGCNYYSARYLVRETIIVVSPVTTTSMACRDNDTTVQESRYYALVGDAMALRVNNRVLTLYGTDGKPLLVFSPE